MIFVAVGVLARTLIIRQEEKLAMHLGVFNTFNFLTASLAQLRFVISCASSAHIILSVCFLVLHAIMYQNMYSVRTWFSVIAMRTTLRSRVSLWQYTTSQTLHHTTSLLYPRLSSLK
jgi:hypothetical protein